MQFDEVHRIEKVIKKFFIEVLVKINHLIPSMHFLHTIRVPANYQPAGFFATSPLPSVKTIPKNLIIEYKGVCA